jgi:7-carboxy-7-deazaguanine synthase
VTGVQTCALPISYTSWKPEGADLTLDQILDEVKARFPLDRAKHVVVTGGEPMIAPEIVSLTGKLRERGLHITIETAGTVFAPVACDLMSISPKLSNSTPSGPWAARHDQLRIQRPVLAELMGRYDYQLKFVIAKPDDLEEVWALVTDLQADRARVILMPEGVDRAVLRERSVWLAEIAKNEGARFSPRLHVELWGDRRGV